jgi:hypothetical protein
VGSAASLLLNTDYMLTVSNRHTTIIPVDYAVTSRNYLEKYPAIIPDGSTTFDFMTRSNFAWKMSLPQYQLPVDRSKGFIL